MNGPEERKIQRLGPEWSDTKIAEAFEVSRQTVERLRKSAVTERVDTALQERRHGTVLPKLTGEVSAWEETRNEIATAVSWRFTADDARQAQTSLSVA